MAAARGRFRRAGIPCRTEAELREMRAAGRVVAEMHAAIRAAARPGVTTASLDRVARDVLERRGADSNFFGYHGFPAVICTSVNDEVIHGIPGSRVLEEGDLLSVDCGAEVDGWNGDAAFTCVVGGREAGRPEDLELMDDTEESLWAGIAALRVGASLYAVGAAVEDSLTASGRPRGREYGIVEDYVGHGIGRKMHMDPQVPNYRVSGKGPKVVDGTTICIEPMVTLGEQDNEVLPDDWTVVTSDGSRAAHWEHAVAVTSAGITVLTALDGGAARLGALGAAYAPLD